MCGYEQATERSRTTDHTQRILTGTNKKERAHSALFFNLS